MTSMKTVQFSILSPTPLSKILPLPWSSTFNFKRTAPPSPNDNQSIKGKQNPRIFIIWYHFFRLAFVFSIILLNLPGFQLTSSPLSPFSWIYTLIYAVAQNVTKCLFYNYSYILVLILQPTCFICTAWKRKQTMEKQSHRASEQTK